MAAIPDSFEKRKRRLKKSSSGTTSTTSQRKGYGPRSPSMARFMGDVGLDPGDKRPAGELYRDAGPQNLSQTVRQAAAAPRIQQKGAMGVLQRYTEFTAEQQKKGQSLGWKDPSGKKLRMADNGRMALTKDNARQTAWALDSKIRATNRMLKQQKSPLRMRASGRAIRGRAPRKPNTARKVLYQIVLTDRRGKRPKLPVDCGMSAMHSMGGYATMRGPRRGYVSWTGRYRGGERSRYTKPHRYHSVSGYHATRMIMGDMLKYVLAHKPGKKYRNLSRRQAIVIFSNFSVGLRRKLSRQFRFNHFAIPRPGESITAMPLKEAQNFRKPKGTYQFHFAMNLMRSGQDYLTVENPVGSTPTGWHFDMYGPAHKGQDFYSIWGPAFGNKFAAFVAVDPGLYGVVVTRTPLYGIFFTGFPRVYLASLTRGIWVRTLELRKQWRRVEVVRGPDKGKIGWMRRRHVVGGRMN